MNQPSLFYPSEETLPYKRIRDISWDFRGIPASEGIYRIHPYPAMFHFLVVRRILKEYSREGAWVLDPFMGSGVAATEALLLGRNFVGYDLNPLAVEIARVRTTPLEVAQVEKTLAFLAEVYPEASEGYIPSVPNLTYWFAPETIQGLARLHTAIQQIPDRAMARFFWVAFSETVRETSLADAKEFKLIRRKSRPSSEVWSMFVRIVKKNVEAFHTFTIPSHPKVHLSLECANALHVLKTLPEESFDMIVTSPPYGDSRTTVAYGQFSRLSLWWLGYPEAGNLDSRLLGGHRRPLHPDLPSPVLYEALQKIADKNRKRAEEVFSFYSDLWEVIQDMAPLLKKGAFAFVLVGNRRVKGVELPTDKIVADFFEAMGYVHEATYVRRISNKRMPAQNSPSNVVGQRDMTMRYEYLVHLRRVS